MQVHTMSTIFRSRGALAAAVTAALAGSILTAPAVSAAAPEGPGQGSCKIAEDPSWSGWSNHEQVGEQLAQIERTSGGRVDVGPDCGPVLRPSGRG
ncbi:hypothetical protein [Micromonospora sp. NPDC048830]|uniref:hypothetical protein n=1 Tax=Micromonospora sp. NPDC048830 TaxID=3364257 RepID=UPI0037115109